MNNDIMSFVYVLRHSYKNLTYLIHPSLQKHTSNFSYHSLEKSHVKGLRGNYI